MRILTKEEFVKEPNGTVFTTTDPMAADDNLYIKTGYFECNNKPTWDGEIPLIPGYSTLKDDDFKNYYCNWCSIDTSECDYDDNQLFYVFSKNEVIQMINLLMWSLSGCTTNNIDENKWYGEDDAIFTDEDMLDIY